MNRLICTVLSYGHTVRLCLAVLIATSTFVSCIPESVAHSGYYGGIIPVSPNEFQEVSLHLSTDMKYAMRVILSSSPAISHFYSGMWEYKRGVITLYMDGLKDWRLALDRDYLLIENNAAINPDRPSDALSLRKLSR